MNKILTQCMIDHTVKISDKIHGTATEVFKNMPMFLDKKFKSAMKMLDPEIPLVYEGYRKLTPKEEYRANLSSGTKSAIDLAVSTLYMVEYIFSYDGQKIRKPLLLPYAERGNILRISNTPYTIAPVLSDRVITPSDNGVFIRLLISKINMYSISRNIYKNDQKIPMSVIYSTDIARVNISSDKIGKPVPPIALYLFSKYGVCGTFEKYLGVHKSQIIITDELETIDSDKYNIYRSTQSRPRSHRDHTYEGHNVCIAIDKEVMDSPILENLVSSLIYSLDMLPELGDDVKEVILNLEEEKYFWLLLLGRLTYKDAYSQARIIADMKAHLNVINGYLDQTAKDLLVEVDLNLEDFFDLLAAVLDNYNKWVINSKEYNSNLDNRYVDIDYYTSYDIVYSFNKVLLNLNRRKTKTLDGLRYKEVVKIFSEFSSKKIYSLVKSSATNLTLMVADISLDMIYIKSTSTLEDQSRGQGVNRGAKSQFPANTRFIKGQDPLIGSLLYLAKKSPSPRFKANIFMDYSVNTGKVDISEENINIAETIDKMLSGRIDENDEEYAEIAGAVDIIDNEEDYADMD